MTLFISENGVLKSPKQLIDRKGSKKYKPIGIGKPLSIIYLYFYLKSKDLKHGTDALMISHFLKLKPNTGKAPEVVSYFDENCPLKNRKGEARISNFNPEEYGHRLIYYSKSFMGQNIDFTTKVMDVHQMTGDKKVLKIILENAIPLVASKAILPTFLLPLASVGKNKNLIGKLIDLVFSVIWRKKGVLHSDPVSLALNTPSIDSIQSGRYVVIPKITKTQEKRVIRENFKLNLQGNKLVEINNPDQEYSEYSYYVFQINGKPIKSYEDFEVAKGTAEILTNVIGQKQIDLPRIATDISDALKSKKDMDSLKKLTKKLPKIEKKALTNLLSDDAKEVAKKMKD